MLVFGKSRTGGVSLEDKTKLDVVGLGGGNGTSKVGAGRKGGGSREEYEDQDIGKVRRIEKDDRNGETGADSSEDVRGMEKNCWRKARWRQDRLSQDRRS